MKKKKQSFSAYTTPIDVQRKSLEENIAQRDKQLVGWHVTWYSYTWENDFNSPYAERDQRYSGTILSVQQGKVSIRVDGSSTIARLSLSQLDHQEDWDLSYLIGGYRNALAKLEVLEDETEYTVYALSDPRSCEIRYVGISFQVHFRYRQHTERTSANHKKNAWIQELTDLHLKPGLHILDIVRGGAYARQREYAWVQKYHAAGARLTNIDLIEGGEVAS